MKYRKGSKNASNNKNLKSFFFGIINPFENFAKTNKIEEDAINLKKTIVNGP
jgi:hypothetical protein